MKLITNLLILSYSGAACGAPLQELKTRFKKSTLKNIFYDKVRTIK